MSILKVQNIAKAYRTYRSEWHRFARWFGLPIKLQEEIWVLENINFTIEAGEAIGIVGQNGAGKSTLLKIITGTTSASNGDVHINGHVSAMLELGMGFNPELTGRQNTYHAASIMGFSHEQIDEKIAEIESFAEIGDYFDQPVRVYSTGMHVRVTFAVATAWRPELLIVDEALSVGDSYFQHKSFARIKEFQEKGTSLLLVSHDRSAIQALCNRAILLKDGHIIQDGSPEAVFDYYNALIAEKEDSKIEVKTLETGEVQTIFGSGEVKIEEVLLINSKGEVTEHIAVGEQVQLQVKVAVMQNINQLLFGYGIKDRLGQVMYGINTWHSEQVIYNAEAGEEYLFKINFTANLGVGSYSVQVNCSEKYIHSEGANYTWQDFALFFNVTNADKAFFGGVAWLPPNIEITRLTDEAPNNE